MPVRTRLAVIGCGRWGPNHIRNFERFPDCEVLAVDVDDQCLRSIQQMFPQVECVRDVSKVWNDSSISAVIVATPSASHFELVRESLLHDKHVLCEKPLCQHSYQAIELLALAASKQLTLMTGYTYLHSPGISKIKQLILQGDLGQVQYLAAVRANLGPIRPDVNVAQDLASHDIAIINWLLESEPNQVSAFGGNFVQPGIHDVAFINLVYPDGQIANIHASWIEPRKIRQMTIVGAQRMATWDDLDRSNPVVVHDCGARANTRTEGLGEPRVTMWDRERRHPAVTSAEPLATQAGAFLEAITGGQKYPSDTGFSLGVVRVLEAVEHSLFCGGKTIALDPLPPSVPTPVEEYQ